MGRRRSKKIKIRVPSLKLKSSTNREIQVIFLFALSVLTGLSLLNQAGVFGVNIASVLFRFFGIGAYIVPFALAIAGILVFYSSTLKPSFARFFGVATFFFSILGLIHLALPLDTILEVAKAGQYGGYVGFTLTSILRYFVGDAGSLAVLIATMLIGILIAFDITLKKIFGFIEWVKEDLPEEKDMHAPRPHTQSNNVSTKPVMSANSGLATSITRPASTAAATVPTGKLTSSTQEPLHTVLAPTKGDYKFPPLSLLGDNNESFYEDPKEIEANVHKLYQTLLEFSVIRPEDNIHIDANLGPTVTQYTFTPPSGVKLKNITALESDIALKLKAESIRIEAPIPGKDKVGIEIPNKKRAMVKLKEVVLSEPFKLIKSPLRIALGKNVNNEFVTADLKKMPHLLIAGATGSGKSVCMNAILVCLLYQNAPEDMRFILIDPKRVELNAYRGIPHLLTPVITDPDKAILALRWAVAEMNHRYKQLESAGEVNIENYNKKKPEEKMPYIVIVIDELADLMMVASKEIEASICRVAQMARAVGIHLIVATQRPSVDVITGLIKANIPARIAFTVSSGIDSRTILNRQGAESLLGAGDMLYQDPNNVRLMRVQGIYVSSDEVKSVTNEIKLTSPVEYQTDVIEEKREIPEGLPNAGTMGILGSNDNFEDALEKEAIEFVIRTQKASATLLQRHLRVGYARAARLLDILEQKGIVGPADGAKPRKIMVQGTPVQPMNNIPEETVL
ncbi:MAG: DNA translocase FtsK [Candidatus Abawacabacteria bacterium]|nr:DNA translocase FtsK [Candidatus Abawacabacteria bacterium]